MSEQAEGRIVTFYSFKGGTGRSMALANIAHVLSLDSTDPNILMIDWDLEAPGLHRYFDNALAPLSASRYRWLAKNRKSVDGYLGLIDLLETAFSAYQKDKLTAVRVASSSPPAGSEAATPDERQARRKQIREGVFANLDQYLLQCESGRLFLMKAGAFDPEDTQSSARKTRDVTIAPYAERIRRFNWEEFYECDPDFFPAFRRHLMGRFDYVLIDSRTGLTDSSGICTKQLPEVLILVFAPNQQNIDGLINVVRGVKSYRYSSIDSRPVMIYPVASRIDGQYQPLRDTWRKGGEDDGKTVKGYQLRFEELLKDTYDLDSCDLTAFFDLTQIPHDGAYSYGEKLAAKLGTSDTLSMGWRYANLARLLVADRAPWEAGAETTDTPAGAKQTAPTRPVVFRKWLWLSAFAALFLLANLAFVSNRVFRYYQQRTALQQASTARAKLAAGNPQGALIDFSSAIQKLPDNVTLYRDRAYAFKLLGNNQKAMEDYDHVLSIQTDIQTLRDRAYMYRLLGNPAKADADYRTILRIAPKDVVSIGSTSPASPLVGKQRKPAPVNGLTLSATPNQIMGWLLLGRVDEAGQWAADSPKDTFGIPLPTLQKGASFRIAYAAPLAAEPIASAKAPTVCTLLPGQIVEVAHTADVPAPEGGTFVWVEVGVEVGAGGCKP